MDVTCAVETRIARMAVTEFGKGYVIVIVVVVVVVVVDIVMHCVEQLKLFVMVM